MSVTGEELPVVQLDSFFAKAAAQGFSSIAYIYSSDADSDFLLPHGQRCGIAIVHLSRSALPHGFRGAEFSDYTPEDRAAGTDIVIAKREISSNYAMQFDWPITPGAAEPQLDWIKFAASTDWEPGSVDWAAVPAQQADLDGHQLVRAWGAADQGAAARLVPAVLLSIDQGELSPELCATFLESVWATSEQEGADLLARITAGLVLRPDILVSFLRQLDISKVGCWTATEPAFIDRALETMTETASLQDHDGVDSFVAAQRLLFALRRRDSAEIAQRRTQASRFPALEAVCAVVGVLTGASNDRLPWDELAAIDDRLLEEPHAKLLLATMAKQENIGPLALGEAGEILHGLLRARGWRN